MFDGDTRAMKDVVLTLLSFFLLLLIVVIWFVLTSTPESPLAPETSPRPMPNPEYAP